MKFMSVVLVLYASINNIATAQERYEDNDLIDNFNTDTVEEALKQIGFDPDINWALEPAMIEISHRVTGTKVRLRPN